MRKLWDKFIHQYAAYWFGFLIVAVCTLFSLGGITFAIKWILTMLEVI